MKTNLGRIITSVFLLYTTTVFSQNYNLLNTFKNVAIDTTVSSLNRSIIGYDRKNNLPDSIVIHYFLENKKEKLYGTTEVYNMDENSYKDVPYKRKVNALFAKQISINIRLLCYWFEEIAYLSIYDIRKDTIVQSYNFCIPPNAGESFIHSTLYPNNSIFTVETKDKTLLKLTKIDTITYEFKEEKNIFTNDYISAEDVMAENEKYQNALKLLGIEQNVR